MANKPFDREIINVRERPFSSDINLASTYSDLALREILRAVYSERVSFSDSRSTLPDVARFIGDGFKVRPTSPASLSVTVSPGIGFVRNTSTSFNINSILGLNDFCELKPIVLSLPKTFNIPAVSPSEGSRTDIVEVNFSSLLLDQISRDIFNPVLGAFEPTDVFKTFSWCLDGRTGFAVFPNLSTEPLSYRVGTTEVTPGYTKLAEIFIADDTITFVDEGTIVDSRFGRHHMGNQPSLERLSFLVQLFIRVKLLAQVNCLKL